MRLFCLVLAAVVSTAAPAQEATLFRFTEKAGPHLVGLRVVEQYDYSRTYRRSTDELGKPYDGERARPLQTLIWYPSERSGAKQMTVDDYLSLWATETSFGHPETPAVAMDWRSGMNPTLAMSLWAVRDAPIAAGRFPVVIYAPGGSSVAWENADLCEFLASYGYLVIASPSLGESTRNMTYDVAGANAQARDLSFLIGFARTLPDADISAISVVGHSWGGISNLFAAARDSRIDALISLDGSLRYVPAVVKQAGDVHPGHMNIPLLSFIQRNFSLEMADSLIPAADKAAPNVLNEWTHGDLISVHMLGLAHSEFTSRYQRNEDKWLELFNDWPMLQGDFGRDDAIAGYAWMARYTLRFLDAYLKHDATAMAFLRNTPADNGVPRHLMVVEFRAAEGVPVSFDGFRMEVGRRGFAHIDDIYAAFKKESADFKLDETAVGAWADELIADDHMAEAIGLLKVNKQMHPESSEANLRLADAYALTGQKRLATECLRMVLERDPHNGDAQRKFNRLEGH